jgi:hypothetical protein
MLNLRLLTEICWKVHKFGHLWKIYKFLIHVVLQTSCQVLWSGMKIVQNLFSFLEHEVRHMCPIAWVKQFVSFRLNLWFCLSKTESNSNLKINFSQMSKFMNFSANFCMKCACFMLLTYLKVSLLRLKLFRIHWSEPKHYIAVMFWGESFQWIINLLYFFLNFSKKLMKIIESLLQCC